MDEAQSSDLAEATLIPGNHSSSASSALQSLRRLEALLRARSAEQGSVQRPPEVGEEDKNDLRLELAELARHVRELL